MSDKKATGSDPGPLNFVEAILAEAGAGEVEEFTITIGNGHTMRGKAVRDADALNRVMRRARAFVGKNKTNTPPQWHEFLPISQDTALGMAFCEAMLVEPKLSHLDMLKLARGAGAWWLQIVAELRRVAFNVQYSLDEEALDSEGEGSALTGGTAHS